MEKPQGRWQWWIDNSKVTWRTKHKLVIYNGTNCSQSWKNFLIDETEKDGWERKGKEEQSNKIESPTNIRAALIGRQRYITMSPRWNLLPFVPNMHRLRAHIQRESRLIFVLHKYLYYCHGGSEIHEWSMRTNDPGNNSPPSHQCYGWSNIN